MRILMPSITDPVTALSGAATVTRGLIRLLELPPLSARVTVVPMRPPGRGNHRARQAIAILRSLVSPLPAKVAFTCAGRFGQRVASMAQRESFDLVILNGSDLLWLHQHLPPSLPRLLVAHNIEHLLFASQVEQVLERFPALRPLAEREVRRLEHFETAGIRGVGNCVFLSSDDAGHERGGALARRRLVMPPVFCEPRACWQRTPDRPDRLDLGFVGNMAWWPNQQGLRWLLREVLPRVGANVHLHLFGQGTAAVTANDDRVTAYGPVAELGAVWSRCDLMLCPMRSGGGVSIKLAEAVYHGMPVLATPLAARGLPLGADPCLTILDQADDWVAFLNSSSALELRGRRIAPALSERFAVDTHRAPVQGFVEAVAGRTHHAPVEPRAGASVADSA